jgi:hypothetical protein
LRASATAEAPTGGAAAQAARETEEAIAKASDKQGA